MLVLIGYKILIHLPRSGFHFKFQVKDLVQGLYLVPRLVFCRPSFSRINFAATPILKRPSRCWCFWQRKQQSLLRLGGVDQEHSAVLAFSPTYASRGWGGDILASYSTNGHSKYIKPSGEPGLYLQKLNRCTWQWGHPIPRIHFDSPVIPPDPPAGYCCWV